MRRNLRLCLHWARMLAGSSYYHVPQKLGKAFEPDRLHGYFNDMTGKANWQGLLDDEGIPVNQLIDGSTCYFATTIIQKALGHYDHFILSGSNHQLDEFIKICDWLVKIQDKSGGWDVKSVMSLTGELKYSAMPLGEAISALVRAWKQTDVEVYLEAAKRAYQIMMKTIEEGGTAYYRDNDIYLEEYPAKEKNTVLNGWIFALFGIYDLFLATNDDSVQALYKKAFNSLRDYLEVFDAGFWSYYDERGSIASPFYHDLHISQLEALFIVSGDGAIKEYIERWKDYRKNPFKKCYAFFLKATQKLKKPSAVIIIE